MKATTRRLLALVLALSMCLSQLNTTAWAADIFVDDPGDAPTLGDESGDGPSTGTTEPDVEADPEGVGFGEGEILVEDPAPRAGVETRGDGTHTHDDITFTAWESSNSLPNTAGSYYLTNDVMLTGTWTPANGETKLCLNGHTISANGGAFSVITVNNAEKILDIYDESDAGQITGSRSTGNGGGISITAGHVTLHGGIIQGNRASNGGGASVNGADAWLSMDGGTIQYNEGYGNTGGVLLAGGGRLTMSGGSIQYNAGKNFGGIGTSNAKMEFSGEAQIKDNYIFSDLAAAVYKVTNTDGAYAVAEGGTPCNVKMANDADMISVVDELANTASIGIFTTRLFTNSETTDYNVADRFFSDDDNFTVYKNGAGQLRLIRGTLGEVPYREASWNEAERKVEYADKTVQSPTLVEEGTTSWSNGKWYVVASNVNIASRITVSGTVNLILCDGCRLNANKGIQLHGSNALNVYGQGAGTGFLYATGGGASDKGGLAGIGGNNTQGSSTGGKLTIHGGTVQAIGSKFGAAIGGGNLSSHNPIVIYGGDVRATGGDQSAAIGGGDRAKGGNTTIYGGSVTAVSNVYGSGIGGGYNAAGGTLSIYGGTVYAKGGGSSSSYGGRGIGGGSSNNNAGTVNIYGGDVTATSGNSKQSGIGPGGTVNIGSNMTVRAGTGTSATTPCPDYATHRVRTVHIWEHTHDISYEASGNTITGTCSVTDPACSFINNQFTLSVNASNAVYDEAAHGGTLAGGNLLHGVTEFNAITGESFSNESIDYYQGETKLEGAPTDAGSYTAQFTFAHDQAEYVISKDYQIAKAPAPDPSTITDEQRPTAKTGDDVLYTGEPVALVTDPSELPANYTGVQYSTDGGQTWVEVPTGIKAGDYTVKVRYTSNNYEDLAGSDVMATIVKDHVHHFTDYTVSGNTITATCTNHTNCPLADEDYTATMTISAPSEGGGSATLTGRVPFDVIDEDIQYFRKSGDDWTPIEDQQLPSDSGFYRASVTVTDTEDDTKTYVVAVDYGVNAIIKDAEFDATAAHGDFTVPEVAAVDASITITATPADGYELDALTVTGPGGTSVPTTKDDNTASFTMPASDVTVSATFAPIDYCVTIDDGIENGTVTTTTTGAVHIGDEVTLTVAPAEGYGLESIATTSGTLAQTALDGESGVATYVLTMGAGDATVTAEFAKSTIYTVFYSASASPDAVRIRFPGASGEGYAMTSSAKLGNIDCWSIQVPGGAGIESLSFAIKEGDGEWAILNIPVNSDIPDALPAGSAVAIEGEVKAFVVDFVWGEDAEADGRYYLVTSNTDSIDVPNPANTADASFTGWTYLVPSAQEGEDAEEVAVSKSDGQTTTVSLAKISQTTIVSAVWTPTSRTVSFDPNNGGAVTTQSVVYGQKVAPLAAPAKEGYEFVGWVLADNAVEKVGDKAVQFSPGAAFDFDAEIINDLSLKATWRHVHAYVCLQLDDPVFGGMFADYYGYKDQLHVRLCTSFDDYCVEAHSFVNGRCACGATIADNKVTLTEYVGGTTSQSSVVKNSVVSITAPQKQDRTSFSKWQYSANTSDGQDGTWYDLSTMRGVAFAIPANLSARAVYEQDRFQLTINSFKYGSSHVAFQFNYSVPDGFTVVDGGLMLGDNLRMKFWDCTLNLFAFGSSSEPSLRDAVSVYGGGTIAGKMFNYQTINEPGVAKPLHKALATFGKTGTVALAYQPYTSEGYMKALGIHVKDKDYDQAKYPTYAMGYIVCKDDASGGYAIFSTRAISATLASPNHSDVTQIPVS